MAGTGESLRHQVGQHSVCGLILDLYQSALDFITDVVVLDVDVLGTTMVDWVLGHLDAGLVVFEDDQVRRCDTNDLKQLAQ